MRFTVNFTRRFFLFVLLTVLGLVITGGLGWFISLKFGATVPALRILIVLQDLLVFMLPPMVTALLITRLPATFLAVDRKPMAAAAIVGVVLLTVSTPVMDALVAWNNSIRLPESMAGIERMMRAAEQSNAQMIETVFGGNGIGSLVMGILIVGILAGFTEELFFRGGLQRLLTTANVNAHVAVWVTAFLFSAMHFQFYGFFPRLLLGALFGYALVWTGSLWVPVILHAYNNIMYVVIRYASDGATAVTGAEDGVTAAVSSHPLMVAGSALVTAVLVWLLYKLTHHPASGCPGAVKEEGE